MVNTSTALVRDNFDSISEGCFLVLPKKRQSATLSQSTTPKKTKTKKLQAAHYSKEEEDQPISYNGFQQLFNGQESLETMLYRKQSFEAYWSKMDQTINNILLDMNQHAVQNICDFVDKDHSLSNSSILLPFHEIPTGLVFAGINTPDHGKQFQHIAVKLSEPPSPKNNRKKENLVVLLQSKDCTNIKTMIKALIEKFMETKTTPKSSATMMDTHMEEAENESEEDEDTIQVDQRTSTGYSLTGQSKAKPSKCLPYDMRLLEGWYRNLDHSPNLVIVLQDFESFEPSVLQDFFSICSEYRQRIPIICIVGIATSSEILHQSLTKATIGLLRIEKFKLELSEVWFKRVLEQLFLNSTGTLKFGARPFKFLLDRFYLYDFSISKVTASLKYALMHHFYGNPLSVFLPLFEQDSQDTKETIQDWLDRDMLSEHHVTHIRMLSSFRNYIESLVDTQPKKALCLLEDDHVLLTETLPVLLHDIKTYQQEFRLGFNLVVLLQAQFPRFSSLRKSRHLLLLESLEANTQEIPKMIALLTNLVRKMDETHTNELLVELRKLVNQHDYQNINQIALEQLSVWEARYQNLVGADDSYTARMERKAKRLEGMVLPEDDGGGRHTETAKKVQTQSIEHLKRKGTEASKIAMSIADWLDKTLSHYLRPYTTVPLFELVYYTNVVLHEKSFAPQPRASVQTALTQPQHYINCSCCNTEKTDQILPSEDDACILYKLYLECGRMINLYDWYIAFESFVERESRPSKKTMIKNEVQARFIRSVAELQFLGFIKPTQRKTDHVLRLTWSNI